MAPLGKLGRRFSDNVGAWMLAALLALSVFSHYRTGEEFTRVCERVSMLADGYVDLQSTQRFEASGIDMKALLVDAQKGRLWPNQTRRKVEPIAGGERTRARSGAHVLAG